MQNYKLIVSDLDGTLLDSDMTLSKKNCDAIERLYDDRSLALTLSRNNLEEAKKYHPDKVMAEFYEFMDA